MKKQTEKDKLTALYERLSHDDERASPGGKVRRPLRMVSDHYRLHTETPEIYGAQGTGENRMRELQDQEQPKDRAGGTIYLRGRNPRHCGRGNVADRTEYGKPCAAPRTV